MDFSQAELGPKMQACSPRERQFVWHYLQNGGNATQAARDAGVPDPGPESASVRVAAHKMMHRERVLCAIEEVGRQAFRSLLVPAYVATRTLIEKSDHPDHARTLQSTLSRLGLVERSGLDVNVSGHVTVNHTDDALDSLRTLKDLCVPHAKLVEIFGFSGLERYERMLVEADQKRIGGPVIEGEVVRD